MTDAESPERSNVSRPEPSRADERPSSGIPTPTLQPTVIFAAKHLAGDSDKPAAEAIAPLPGAVATSIVHCAAVLGIETRAAQTLSSVADAFGRQPSCVIANVGASWTGLDRRMVVDAIADFTRRTFGLVPLILTIETNPQLTAPPSTSSPSIGQSSWGSERPAIEPVATALINATTDLIQAGAFSVVDMSAGNDRLQQQIKLATDRAVATYAAAARRTIVQKRFARLTEKERDVLDLIQAGYSNRQIAENLKISVRAVEDRRSRAMKRMEATSLVDLIHLLDELQRS